VKRGHHMGVGVECQRGRAVAQQLLNDLRVHAPTQQMRRGRMSEVVNSNPRQSS
jgi:hypothetical protein